MDANKLTYSLAGHGWLLIPYSERVSIFFSICGQDTCFSVSFTTVCKTMLVWPSLQIIFHSEYSKVFLNFFYCCSFTVVQNFPPLLPNSVHPPSHIQTSPTLFLFWGPLYLFLDLTLPLLFSHEITFIFKY